MSMENVDHIKKVHLHLHMDGAVRYSTIFELAKAAEQLTKDVYCVQTLDELREIVSLHNRTDLANFLAKFRFYEQYFIGNEVNIQRMAKECVEGCAHDGVVYAEFRYSPGLLADPKLSAKRVIEAVMRGIKEGQAAHPQIIVKQIFCALTFFDKAALDQNLALAKAFKDIGCGDCGCVAIDIAGAAGDSFKFNQEQIAMFQEAKKLGINRTAHAGENSGWEVVKQAVDELHAERIGHGYHALDPAPGAKVMYQKMLKDRIHFEVCPRSSWYTSSVDKDYAKHPMVTLVKDRANFSINADDPTVVRGWLKEDYETCVLEVGLRREDILQANINAMESAFCSEPERQEVLKILRDSAVDVMESCQL